MFKLNNLRIKNLERLNKLKIKGGLYQELAFFLAGVASFAKLLPGSSASKPISFLELIVATMLSVGALLAVGLILGNSQSVLRLLGGLTAGGWIIFFTLVVWLSLRQRGRRVLITANSLMSES